MHIIDKTIPANTIFAGKAFCGKEVKLNYSRKKDFCGNNVTLLFG